MPGIKKAKTIIKKVSQLSHPFGDGQLIFEHFNLDEDIIISINTGEYLMDWVKRKLKKPFSMLIILSARLPELQHSSWSCSVESYELILVLMNIRFKDTDYFNIGIGTSKSKARNDAASKILETSSLLEWLDANFSDYTI